MDYEIWGVIQHRVYRRQIHSVNDLKRRLIDVWCGLEQSIFTRLLTSGEEDIESVFMLKKDISSTAGRPICYNTFGVTCLSVASLITISCQQHIRVHFTR